MLRAYRGLLRAARKTFAGDVFALSEAGRELRAQFEAGRGLEGAAAAGEAPQEFHEQCLQARVNDRGTHVGWTTQNYRKNAVSDRMPTTVLQSDDVVRKARPDKCH